MWLASLLIASPGRAAMASGSTVTASDEAAVVMPEDVLRAISEARPVCWWHENKRCRKGRKCTFLHASGENSNEGRLPHVSIGRDSTGKLQLHLRPPLADALAQYFRTEMPDRQHVLGPGNRLDEDGKLMMYSLSLMEQPDLQECTALATRGFVTLNGRTRGQCTNPLWPEYMVHGTSLNSAFSIIKDGFIRASPGVCGEGRYGFRLADLESSAIIEQYDRTAAGGYNRGALLVMKCHGLLAHLKSEEVGSLRYDLIVLIESNKRIE